MGFDLHHNVKILVAEDDPIYQKETLRHLFNLGYIADVVVNGKEALEVMANEWYDILFLDCQMPELDGLETASEIRNQEKGAKRTVIVALTSLKSKENRIKCAASGMDDYLVKPIDPKELERRLQYWTRLLNIEEKHPLKVFSGAVETNFEVQLIPLFLQDAPQRIEAMRAALKVQDARVLGRAAHTLKSSSAIMGAMQMSHLCEMLEDQGESGSLVFAGDTFARLEFEFELVRRSLEIKLHLHSAHP